MRPHTGNISSQWSSTPNQMRQQQSLKQLQMISAMYHVLILMSLTQITRAAAPHTPAADKRSASLPTFDTHPLLLHVNKTCLARTCDDTLNEQHLHELERNIDPTVNACDDFHRYACGNWKPPSAYNTAASMLQVAEEQLTARYIELFEGEIRRRRAHWHSDALATSGAVNRATQRQRIRRARARNRRRSAIQTQLHTNRIIDNTQDAADSVHIITEDFNLVFSKLLQYYRVCTHSEPLTLRGYYEQLRAEGLLQPERSHWQEMQANFARFGYGEQFVHFQVCQQNASQHDINVLPHDTRKHVNLTEEIYEILRAHTQLSRAELAKEFKALENDVAAIVRTMCAEKNENAPVIPLSVSDELAVPSDQPLSSTNAEVDCDRSEILTVAELTTRCNEIDWQRFIGTPLGRHLHASDLIRVESLDTICKLARYHNQAQHAQINFLYTLARFLNYLQQQQYNPIRLGSSNATCIRHMRKTLSVAMTYVYDHVYYAPVRSESDHIIHTIFAQLKTEFARTISHNRMQFDADVIAYLNKKLHSLRLNLGNLPPKANSSFFVDLIWKLNVSNNNFYSNHLHALAHAYGHARRLASSASKNHSRSPWYTFNHHDPTFVDNLDWTPYYFCLSNIIIVPHAYLQMPFYDRQFWATLLYGDLANTLGHELIHSFDSNFLEYDHVGNMNERMMQRISSNVNFAHNTGRAHC